MGKGTGIEMGISRGLGKAHVALCAEQYSSISLTIAPALCLIGTPNVVGGRLEDQQPHLSFHTPPAVKVQP